MTEKEKMHRHVLYDANYDEELIEERKVAKELCYDFNQLRPSDEEGQQRLLSRLLGKVGKNTCIIAPFWCDYGYNIEDRLNSLRNNLRDAEIEAIDSGDKSYPASVYYIDIINTYERMGDFMINVSQDLERVYARKA
jgi:acetyltransferase-like isoleucine patch superfamily enzyme